MSYACAIEVVEAAVAAVLPPPLDGAGGAGGAESESAGGGGAVGMGSPRRWSPLGRHGKWPSSKKTSEVHTTFDSGGTQTLYAPGVCCARPRLMPTQARGSKLVLVKAERGLTAYARQPYGRIVITFGFSPVSTS